MSDNAMNMASLTTDDYIPTKLYPDTEEAKRCEIAQRMGLPLIPRVTENAIVRFYCIYCKGSFKVLGRVAMSGFFACPRCELNSESPKTE